MCYVYNIMIIWSLYIGHIDIDAILVSGIVTHRYYWYIIKLWFQVYNVILWYILQNDHHNKSGEHLLLEIVTIFFLRWELKRSLQFSSVPLLSHVQLFATPWIAARQASLSITNSRNLSKLMSIESLMPSSHLILCRPLLLLPPIPPSIRVFSNESTLRMRWPKYWSFSFSISPSNEHQGLISFKMDCLDLLAVQGTLRSLLQHHSSKASILWCSAFFTVQL